MRARSFKPGPEGEGPQRLVTTHARNYAGTYTSYKSGSVGKQVQWESLTAELVLAWLLERDPGCVRYVDQAVKCGGMTIDFLSYRADGTAHLHYVKPASKLLTDVALAQLRRWQRYAEGRGWMLDVVTTRALSTVEQARLPQDCSLTILPGGVALDNLKFLCSFASPSFCSPVVRNFLRDVWRDGGGGEFILGALAATTRSTDFEPLHPLYHLIWVGEIAAPDEASGPIGPGSRARWMGV